MHTIDVDKKIIYFLGERLYGLEYAAKGLKPRPPGDKRALIIRPRSRELKSTSHVFAPFSRLLT
jgi:hypothetical protein